MADLPWGEHAVAVQPRVRKLFCDNARCKRRIPTERLPGVAAPWARKAARLSNRLTVVGLALGSAAGARLGRSTGLATSRNTLLRLVRRAPVPLADTPTTLGVDDWTLRGRAPERLDPWLQRAQDNAVAALQRFAKRLSPDCDAVRAAVTRAWSNGQVEGGSNRLERRRLLAA